MTIEEMKAQMGKVQSGKNVQNFRNSKTNSATGEVTRFQDVANSAFEERRKKEVNIMRNIVYGKTPANILKTTSERNDATEVTFKTRDGKVVDSKYIQPQRMTAESFIKTIMTIRNLSGQNVMIPESEVENMGLELAPYAKPFYDANNNKFYELSVTRRANGNNGKRLKFYANNKVTQAVVDKLNAPATAPKDGVDPNVKSALDICEKLGTLLGVTLVPSKNGNVFMPSTLGKVSKKAKETLSTLTLNKWKSKKFVPQSGKLLMNIEGMNGTEVLTSYISNCAMRSFNTNIETFLNVVNSDRGFLNGSAQDKKAQIEDYKKNYELIKYKIHNICSDLIASEMCKMLPDTTAEERLALSEGYLTSAMQRMNGLGKYLDDPYVMKFISTTVTDSVSRYNANFTFSTKEIVDANCKVCGYKNLFKVGNREKAIFGEYEVPTNGDFQFSAYPSVEASKATEPKKTPEKNAEETPAVTPKVVEETKVEPKKKQQVDKNIETGEDALKNTVMSLGKNGQMVFNVANPDNVRIIENEDQNINENFEIIDGVPTSEVNNVVNEHKPEATKEEQYEYIYDALSPEGKDVFEQFPECFDEASPTADVIKYVLSKNYPDGTAIEVSNEHKMIINSKNPDKFEYEYYDNGYKELLKAEKVAQLKEESRQFREENKYYSSTPVDVVPSPGRESNGPIKDENLMRTMFSNVERGEAKGDIVGYTDNNENILDTGKGTKIETHKGRVDDNGIIHDIDEDSKEKSQASKSTQSRAIKASDFVKKAKEISGKSVEVKNDDVVIEEQTVDVEPEQPRLTKPSAKRIKPTFVTQEELNEALKYYFATTNGTAKTANEAKENEAIAESLKYYFESENNEIFGKSDLKLSPMQEEFVEKMIEMAEETKAKENEAIAESLKYHFDSVDKEILKCADPKIKKCKSVEPGFDIPFKVFGERTTDSIRNTLSKYAVSLTTKALNEKSLSDKKRAIEKEDAGTIASEKAQSISASQNAVTTLFNNKHNNKHAKQAIEVIDKAERIGENVEIIEATTVKELDAIINAEIDKVIQAYEENKTSYPEWGNCKTVASFVNYYYKNIVGAETKYGNDFKKQVKMTCRKMDAAVVVDQKLSRDGVTYRMYDATTFIEKDEKSNIAGLNAYTVRKIVENSSADPKLETVTVYSDNADLVEDAQYDEQFRETFDSVENMKNNDGYIGKGVSGMKKPVVFPRKADELRRAQIHQAIKSDI